MPALVDLLTIGRDDDPLGQALAHSGEYVGQSGGLVLALDLESRCIQARLDGGGGGFHAALAVGEQVDILGAAVNDAVRDQSAPAGEREPVPFRCLEYDGGYLLLQVI